MPFFKILSQDGLSAKLVKGDSVEHIISEAKKKFNIEDDIQMFMSDGKTPVDEDVMELASLRLTDPLELIMTQQKDNDDDQMVVDDLNNNNVSPQRATPRGTPQPQVDLNKVLDRIPPHVLEHCRKGNLLMSDRKLSIAHAVGDYMIEDLKNRSRKIARLLCRMICDKFPTSMSIIIEGNVWDDGFDAFYTSVRNCLNYKSSTSRGLKRKSTEDGDEIEIDRRQKRAALNRNNDEYGCVNYDPKLPENETTESQEQKRKKLLDMFHNGVLGDSKECESLLKATYPTQRSLINAIDRDLDAIFSEWPHLTDASSLIKHSSWLLGKDVYEEWNVRVILICDEMRRYFKSMMHKTRKMERLNQLCSEYLSAMETFRSVEPKFSVVFPLLMLSLGEDTSHLYKTVKVESTEEQIRSAASSDHPVLIIANNSIYGNGPFYVVVERNHAIECSNFLDGILVTFLCYYIFGYSYKRGCENTLEFIQR
ncbi:hypothetical protein QAD02_017763 [Eretmocerus hayati]|uniref:Uncharacterized protein n=1 Tax=Eretmocerus hayati TaxID=131215 RepID=A0ACC2PGN3_9HYME|nr:hypothetical protein QAD02_017763 [Eretmocerus hayati]